MEEETALTRMAREKTEVLWLASSPLIYAVNCHLEGQGMPPSAFVHHWLTKEGTQRDFLQMSGLLGPQERLPLPKAKSKAPP